jgi:hypothetical protein
MSLIYKRTLKGIEESVLRTEGLQLKFRSYLKLVDGKQTAAEIQGAHPELADVELVLGVLQQDGYLEILQ